MENEGLEARRVLAFAYGQKRVPYLEFRFLVRLVKFVLLNEGLLRSPLDFPLWMDFSLNVWKAFREGGISFASSVAVIERDLLVSWFPDWSECAEVARRVALIQGVVI